MYPQRVMTRRRRLRTRTLVVSLAAALAVAIVLPALGAPDPTQGALWAQLAFGDEPTDGASVLDRGRASDA